MKKIMLITSAYTGHGHKSISDALLEQFQTYSDLQVEVVEGFALMGEMGIEMSKIYGPMTRNACDVWKYTYDFSTRNDKMIVDLMTAMIHDRFMRKLTACVPDAIVTVHPMFNGSVVNILNEYHIDIPVISMQADIITIHKTWCDPRSSITLCTTQEAYETSIAQGMPPEKLKIVGFPTRAQFCEAARVHQKADYVGDRPLRCLLMSGGEGSGNMRKYATEILKSYNCHLTVICGRNEKLRRMLSVLLEKRYPGKVDVLGFVTNVQDYMLESDLVIARGSPNTMMEAIVCMAPLIVTGCLPGQEEGNPRLIRAHNLGVLCESADELTKVIDGLIDRQGEQLRAIRMAQGAYRNLDNARNIAALIYSRVESRPRTIPSYRRRELSKMQTQALREMRRRSKLTQREEILPRDYL